MSISMIGIDYNRASVDVRALFSFTKKSGAQALLKLKQEEKVQGCILLSTCNRMELWVSGRDLTEDFLYDFLCREKGLEPSEYRSCFVSRRGRDAVEHLLYLTSGLKSQILAEDQIITQVKDALTMARDEYCTDGVLEVLFRTAVTAAKRVKTEVVFSRANASVIFQAIATLEKGGFFIKGRKCMVIGNGEMGKAAAQALAEAGADVTVTVRQYRSGVVNIPCGCSRINYGDRMELIPSCDLVVSATASPNYTITAELFEGAVFEKKPVLIDLAVPRDIDPALAEDSRVAQLYDIDSFKVDAENLPLEESMNRAAEILSEYMEEFYTWLSGRDIIPRVRELQEEVAEDIRLRIIKTVRKTPMEEKDRDRLLQVIDSASAKVAGKLLYGIRDSVGMQEFSDCVAGLEKLYEE